MDGVCFVGIRWKTGRFIYILCGWSVFCRCEVWGVPGTVILWCTVRGAGIGFEPGNYIVLLGFQLCAGFSHCVLWDRFLGDVLYL